MSDGLGFTVLPCGCTVDTEVQNGVNVFKMTPCKLDCVNYEYAIAEMNKQGKPIEFRRGP